MGPMMQEPPGLRKSLAISLCPLISVVWSLSLPLFLLGFVVEAEGEDSMRPGPSPSVIVPFLQDDFPGVGRTSSWLSLVLVLEDERRPVEIWRPAGWGPCFEAFRCSWACRVSFSERDFSGDGRTSS